MKKFKELRVALFALVACVGMTGCSSDNEPLANEGEQDVYTVKLGWSGEIDVTDAPLARATSDDVYGIQVYSTPNTEVEEGTSVTWTLFAYGLFDDPENISINLLKGYKYKFVATMLRDGKTKLNTSTKNGVLSFLAPFMIANNWTSLTNQFDYQSGTYFSTLGGGSASLKTPNGHYSIPNIDRFYGELENYVPGVNEASAKIQMKRTSFGVKFIAINSILKTGVLEIQMTGAPKMELDFTAFQLDTPCIYDIFTFNNVKKAYTEDSYTETIDVTINWHKADGTIFPLGTHEITFKRNRMTIVTVKITNDSSGSNLGMEITEDGDMEADGENDTTIEDGEIVDTEVDASGN